MSCDTKTVTVVRPVWSNGTASPGTPIFIPFVRLSENDVATARISFQLESSTGNLELIPATRGSNDGWTYPSASADWTGASYTSTTGWTWGTAYAAPNDDYQWIEFGFHVRNTTGSARECATITLVLDTRK